MGKVVQSGQQNLSLKAPGCMVTGIIAHEFMHALGFFHEQSRPDRDDYIKVNFENIAPQNVNNFIKYSNLITDTLDLPYDYGSVMHYGPKSFSINGEPTIVALDNTSEIGQRKQLSQIDIAEIRKHYNCQ